MLRMCFYNALLCVRANITLTATKDLGVFNLVLLTELC